MGVGEAPRPERTTVQIAVQLALRLWYERLVDAEKLDARYGLYIPGDSALAVVLSGLNEAAYAEDPEFDPRLARNDDRFDAAGGRGVTVPGEAPEEQKVLGPALAAANRIIHGNGTENDAQLVAGVLIELVNEELKP